MLQINWQDVANILTLCVPYLIAFGIVLLVGIIVMIACMKLKKPTKFLIRRESLLAILLALVIVVNLICFGPMNSLLTLSTGEGQISEESLHESEALVEEITDEGIVLLKNEGACLPMNGNTLNVFGWSSTNPSGLDKGLWAKIPADGHTTLTKPYLAGQSEDSKNIWKDEKTTVSNHELKSMVEFYKKDMVPKYDIPEL